MTPSLMPDRRLSCVVLALLCAASMVACGRAPTATLDATIGGAEAGVAPVSVADPADTAARIVPDSGAQPLPSEPTAPTVAAAAAAPVCPPVQLGAAPPPTRTRAAAPPPISAVAAVVVDADSGAVLWGKDERTAYQPASVTKIVTALLAVERGDLDEVITVNVDDRRFYTGSRMGLVQGDQFTLRDLLYGLMLPSGNDAAIVIAQRLAGTETEFARQMNARMCELGLTDSTFINSSGLGRGEYNLTSAHDLAQVARVAMQNPTFARIASTRVWTARGSRTLSMANLNELVGSYPGADGVKIGWTPSAGNTIVASATRNGHRVIVALLNTPNRAGESAALLTWAFASFTWPGGG